MKRTTVHWTLRILLCLAVLIGCGVLALYLAGAFAPEPGIGLVHSDPQRTAVKDDSIRQTAQQMDVPLLTAPDGLEPTAACRQLVQAGARVLVIDLDRVSTVAEQTFFQQLTQQGITLLFAGRFPGQELLSGCNDLGWYVGCDPSQAGEVLGTAAAHLRRSGIAPDLNQDDLLQFAWIADLSTAAKPMLLDGILRQCEHYGIYTIQAGLVDGSAATLGETILNRFSTLAPEPAAPQTEAAEPAQTHAASSDAQPELLICSSAAAVQAALDARQQLGWDDIPVIGFAPHAQLADQKLQQGAAALCYYDRDGVSDALALLARNALLHQPVNQDSDLVPTGHTFLFPFLLCES